MIKNKKQALEFLETYSEFELFDYWEGSIWFRFDGEDEFHKPYTIDHETEGIIGATEREAVDYIFRNRKRINEWLKDDGSRKVNAKFR